MCVQVKRDDKSNPDISVKSRENICGKEIGE